MGVETVIIMGITYGMGYIATALISFAISYAAQQLFGAKPETPDFDQSITENLEGATNPIPIIYGSRRVGGTRVFVDTSGGANIYLHTVLSVCEGEVHSIEDILLNDVSITDSKFENHAWGYKHVGTDDQTVDASLNGLLPDLWTENHRLRGVAYVYVRLKFNRDIFNGIPVILCDVKGKKVYDPRTETTAWSDNPALCIRDYLTNTRYGRGIPDEMIDDDAIIAAANYCEEQVTFKDPAGSSYNDNRYRCCGAVNPDEGYLENVKKLLSSCRGMLIFSSGKYKLIIDKPETAAFAFNEDNIVGTVKIGMGDKSIVFNRMRCRYFDTDLGYEQNYFTYDNAALRTSQDNGLILEGDLDLPFTNEIVRIEQIAQMEVKRSRQSIVCTFDSTLEALQNDVGDVVNVTYPRAGWNLKKFRIVRIGLKSEDTVEVSLKEYDASVYNLDAWVPPEEPDTLNPGTYNYDPPNNVSASSGNTELLVAGDGSLISRIRLAWTAPDNGYCTGYEAGFKLTEEENYTDYSTTSLQHVFSSVQDGAHYDLRVRAVYFNGAHSEWVDVLNHIVQGKSAVPDTPSGFAVSNEANGIKKFVWNEVSNLDLRGYRIRYKSGSTGEWSAMTSLHSGNLAGSPWETGTITATGDHRFGLVSVDTSGNESLPVYFNLTLEQTGENATPPGAPSGLAITPMYLSLFLEWTNPAENFHTTEIWISETNDRADAVMLSRTVAPIFIIEREDDTPLYIWLRSLNISGTPGPFNTDDDDGTEGVALTQTDETSAAAITATAAKISSLYAANIAAGSITSGTVIIGPGGAIRSHDYEPGMQGWKLDSAGAELISALIRGTVSAGGAIQSSDFQTGVQGWQISGDGNAEFNNIKIRGEVQAPTISPNGGGYLGFVPVTCYAATGTTPRYTLDGTPPDETDAIFPTPPSTVTVSSTNTLRVIAFESLTGRQSDEVQAHFKVSDPIAVGGWSPYIKRAWIRSYYDSSHVGWLVNGTAPNLVDVSDFAAFTGWAYLTKKTYINLQSVEDGFVYKIGSDDTNGNVHYLWFFQTTDGSLSGRVGPVYVQRLQSFDGGLSWYGTRWQWNEGVATSISITSGITNPDDFPFS